jgi:hypothetical protein
LQVTDQEEGTTQAEADPQRLFPVTARYYWTILLNLTVSSYITQIDTFSFSITTTHYHSSSTFLSAIEPHPNHPLLSFSATRWSLALPPPLKDANPNPVGEGILGACSCWT